MEPTCLLLLQRAGLGLQWVETSGKQISAQCEEKHLDHKRNLENETVGWETTDPLSLEGFKQRLGCHVAGNLSLPPAL